MHRWGGYLHGIQLGIAQYAAQKPNWLLTHVLPDVKSFGLFKRQRPDGVIAFVESDYAGALRELGVPVVDVANWQGSSGFPRVLPDDVAIGRVAADYFVDLGLRQLATLGFAEASFYAERLAGFRQRAAALQTPVAAHSANPVDPPDQWRAWVGSLPKPVGLLCANDGLAAEVLEVCRHAGVRVPDDVGVLGVDNDELICSTAVPPLSSVDMNTPKIGYVAARVLDELIDGQKPPAADIRLPPVGVVARQSTNLLAIADEDVLAAIKFIRDNVRKGVTVAKLMKAIPTNRRSLEKRFKAFLGRSPLQEIRRVRIEKAKELLRGSDLPIPAVARDSGFSNPERLANVFHEVTGMTPTAYRRQNRQQG